MFFTVRSRMSATSDEEEEARSCEGDLRTPDKSFSHEYTTCNRFAPRYCPARPSSKRFAARLWSTSVALPEVAVPVDQDRARWQTAPHSGSRLWESSTGPACGVGRRRPRQAPVRN